VQWVARQDGSQADDFRGYMGRIEAGEVKLGDTITVLPANREATVAEIIAPVPGGTAQVERAFAGQTVTIRLAEDVDVSRGDTFVLREAAPEPAKKLDADLCWFDDTPLSTQRKYLAEADDEHRVRADWRDQAGAGRAYAVCTRRTVTI
jgi:sulfate adenylyltransferase subunit 1